MMEEFEMTLESIKRMKLKKLFGHDPDSLYGKKSAQAVSSTARARHILPEQRNFSRGRFTGSAAGRTCDSALLRHGEGPFFPAVSGATGDRGMGAPEAARLSPAMPEKDDAPGKRTACQG